MGRKYENKKTKKVTVRFTEQEQRLLTNRAKKYEMNLSDYMRQACLNKVKKKTQESYSVFIAVMAQELCTYIEEKYGYDEKIEGWCNEIWMHL